MRLERLKALRARAFLTQPQLAEKAGIAVVTLARLETGSSARPSTAIKLAKALGVEPAALTAPAEPAP